jgi:hypothetical protein
MHVVRDYRGWAPDDPLDPEAESVLAFLDQLSTKGILEEVGEVVARIDEYGVIYEWRWVLVRGPKAGVCRWRDIGLVWRIATGAPPAMGRRADTA